MPRRFEDVLHILAGAVFSFADRQRRREGVSKDIVFSFGLVLPRPLPLSIVSFARVAGVSENAAMGRKEGHQNAKWPHHGRFSASISGQKRPRSPSLIAITDSTGITGSEVALTGELGVAGWYGGFPFFDFPFPFPFFPAPFIPGWK